MEMLPSVGLLPNGHDVAWIALALLLLAVIGKIWRARVRPTLATTNGDQTPSIVRPHNHQHTTHWTATVFKRLYWLLSFILLACLLATLRLPFTMIERLDPATANPLTLAWGNWTLANPSCSRPTNSENQSASNGIEDAASYHRLCSLPRWLSPNLSPYHEEVQQAPTVYENGQAFWGLRSAVSLVRSQGYGRFALQTQASSEADLWYSASDATNPMTNGRTYQLRYSANLSFAHQLIGWLLCLPLLLMLLRNTFAWLHTDTTFASKPSQGTVWLFVLLLGLLCLAPLGLIWMEADSRFAIAGYLPWSDASAWFHGLNHLLTFNELDSWTVRRPLNPVFLSALFHFTGMDWPITLVVRGLLLAASLVFLCRVVLDQFGTLPTLAAVAVAAVFAQDFIPVALTETQGLLFAATGFAWLCIGASQQRLWCYALGTSLVSIALSLRLGPVGLLGAFVLWPLLTLSKTDRWRWFWVTAIAIFVGFAPTWFWTTFFYSGENLPGGNFAYTFYGLAYGGAPWTLFAEHYPELANQQESELVRIVWQQAFAQVQAEPLLLLQGFATFIQNYFRYFFVFLEQPIQRCMILLFALGLLSALFNSFGKSSNPLARLVVLGWLGAIATVPLIYWSLDAYRAYAVSLPLDMLLVAAGARALLNLPAPRWIQAERTIELRGWVGLSATLVLLVTLLPLWTMQQHLPPSNAFDATQNAACREQQTQLLLDMGSSSPYLQLSTTPTATTWIDQVNYQQFRFDPSFYHNEIAVQLNAMQPGDMLVHGFDFAARKDAVQPPPSPVWVVLPYAATQDYNRKVNGLHTLCVEPFDDGAASQRYRVYRALTWEKIL